MQRARQGARHGPIGAGLGSAEVEGAGETMVDDPQHGRDVVTQRDRPDPLAPRTDDATQSDAKERHQALEDAAAGAQHDAGADGREWSPGLGEGSGRGFPGPADLAQEILSRRGVLVEHLVAAAAVVADGRRADQHADALGQRGEGTHQQARRRPTRLLHAVAVRAGPAATRHAHAGQVDDGIEPPERGEVALVDVAAGGVPADLAARDGRRGGTHEAHDLVAARLERATERGPEESRRSGHADAHQLTSSLSRALRAASSSRATRARAEKAVAPLVT